MIWVIKFFNALPKVDSEIVIQESEKIGAIEDLGPLLEPDPIGYSFNTPGWYLIGSLLLMGILYASYRWIKKYRSNAYRRDAIKAVNELNNSQDSDDVGSQLSALMIILKNAALKAYGRNAVASLHGNSWLIFLESKSKNTHFSQYELMISRSIYENHAPDKSELNELRNLSIKWIKTHA